MNQLFLTANECYITGQTITPKGVMVHSTGANNPKISRYVQPVGTAGNHWNQGNIWVCVHGFLGYNDVGEVDFVQTLPWNYRAWHAGSSANDTHISFEICEDDLTDPLYFRDCYEKAVQVVATICIEFDFDPLEDGVILSHAEGYQRKIASNHADVGHWWGLYHCTMDDFRNDVYEEMKAMKQTEFNEMMAVWQASTNQKQPDEWSSEARLWAESVGMISGDENGNFQYKRDCTREELVQILWRYLSKLSEN